MALAIILLVVALSLALWAMSRAGKSFHPAAASLQALVTAAAVILAGGWYLVERRGAVQADIELDVAGAKLAEGAVLVEAKVTIHNRGQVLLKPAMWDVQLLSVAPSNGLPVRAALDAGAAEPKSWPEKIDGREVYTADGEVHWRGLRQYLHEADIDVEPGEKDVKVFDFLVRCPIQAAIVSVGIRNPPSTLLWERDPEEGRCVARSPAGEPDRPVRQRSRDRARTGARRPGRIERGGQVMGRMTAISAGLLCTTSLASCQPAEMTEPTNATTANFTGDAALGALAEDSVNSAQPPPPTFIPPSPTPPPPPPPPANPR